MWTLSPADTELEDAWIEGDRSARWRSAAGHGPTSGDAAASGSSPLEVDAGCRLPRHVDTAEETIVVVSGSAQVTVGDETAELGAGGIALVPVEVPHEVRNSGGEPLRFVAVYAGTDVVTRYERDVAPSGGRERSPLG